MKIGEYLRQGRFSISFEFFPPKTPEGEEELFLTISSLQELEPTFVSVTYGAGGSTRDRTRRVVKRIHEETGLTTMAHLTCIAHSREELLQILQEYRDMGIENILALRGDRPAGDFKPPEGSCRHGSELVQLIRDRFGDHFSVGAASYPEGHPESPNLEWEIRFFKKKVEAGADFSITQMFFDNDSYFRFVELCQKAGVDIPIIPGIMPITNFRQVQKFASMCGATIPQSLIDKLEPYAESPEDTLRIGVDFAIQQCLDLMERGAPGLHFYTLNKSKATLMVYQGIKTAIKA